MKTLIVISLSLVIILMLLWEPLPPTREFQAPSFEIGVHLLMTSDPVQFPAGDWSPHLDYAQQMTGEGGWIVQLIESHDQDSEKWQRFLDDCWARGLRPVFRLATYTNAETGIWVAPDPRRLDELAADWRAFFATLELEHPLYVIIGNEPNRGVEWGGVPNPFEYANYFVAVAKALRTLELDQPLWVSAAALDLHAPHTNGYPITEDRIILVDAPRFIDEMFMAQPHWPRFIDFWTSHVYPNEPFSSPPWEQSYVVHRGNGSEVLPLIDPPVGINNRGMHSYEWEIWYMKHVWGVDLPPILISEMGYRHNDPTDPKSSDHNGAVISPQQIAEYLPLIFWGVGDTTLDGWLPFDQDSRLMGVVYFGLAGAPAVWGHTNLLKVDEDGNILGTYPHYDVLAAYTQQTMAAP